MQDGGSAVAVLEGQSKGQQQQPGRPPIPPHIPVQGPSEVSECFEGALAHACHISLHGTGSLWPVLPAPHGEHMSPLPRLPQPPLGCPSLPSPALALLGAPECSWTQGQADSRGWASQPLAAVTAALCAASAGRMACGGVPMAPGACQESTAQASSGLWKKKRQGASHPSLRLVARASCAGNLLQAPFEPFRLVPSAANRAKPPHPQRWQKNGEGSPSSVWGHVCIPISLSNPEGWYRGGRRGTLRLSLRPPT